MRRIVLLTTFLTCLVLSTGVEAATIKKTVRNGTSFTLSKPSNVSVGWHWEASFDKKMLSLTSDFCKYAVDRPALGASCTQKLTFKALKKGTTTLTLTRTFRGSNEPQEQQDIYKLTIR